MRDSAPQYRSTPPKQPLPFISRDRSLVAPPPQMVELTLRVPAKSAAATLSAVEEIRDEIGTRLTQSTEYDREAAWTHAAIGLAALAAQLRTAGITEAPAYAAR